VATLYEISGGRIDAVIIGAGSHFDSMPGYDRIKPKVAIPEMIELLRRMWAGETVTLDGEIVKSRHAQLDIDGLPFQIPLYVTSRGPILFQMAGEVGDGVLIGSFSTPDGIAYAKSNIQVGLERSGRTFADIKLASWLYLCILEHEDQPVPLNVKQAMCHSLWSSRPVIHH